jgi:hypothetical protein
VTGHHVVPVLAAAAATAATVTVIDPWEGRYFRRHASTFEGYNKFMSENRTTLGTLLIPAGMTLMATLSKTNIWRTPACSRWKPGLI